jgi:predicted flap endonuclease-1-like 5' DNA nuclease
MTYLITQTFILLLAAALLGMLLGWYLTRLSANSSRAGLEARANSARQETAAMREERDALRHSKDGLEAERQALLTEIDELKAQVAKGVATDQQEIDRLRDELAQCRDALANRPEAVEAAPEIVENEPTAGKSGGKAAGFEEIPSVSAAAAAAAASFQGTGAATARPAAEPATASTQADDDLQQIKGIGPKIAATLRELGIRRFEQIAEWTPENVAWINDHLKFKGRVEREEWIPQARALIAARDAD